MVFVNSAAFLRSMPYTNTRVVCRRRFRLNGAIQRLDHGEEEAREGFRIRAEENLSLSQFLFEREL